MKGYFPQTRRAAVGDSDDLTNGYALLERAGYVRSTGWAGIHSLLPLGFRVHRRICDVIYEEMEDAGVLNLQLPILQAQALWEKTDRWRGYVEEKTMFVTEEQHHGGKFGLAPTAEEVITSLVAAELRSWRDLPLRLHQIGPKFRDEKRARLGMLRAREFGMSDAYSFDRTEEEMKESFELFRRIYTRIFERVGLEDVLAVQADSGSIGGDGSAEFMVVSEVGEDTLLVCERCDYGANVEKADSRIPEVPPSDPEMLEMRVERTPAITSVEQLSRRFDGMSPAAMVKTVICTDLTAEPDEDLVAVCIRADLNVEEVKLGSELGGRFEMTSPERIERATRARVGFAGPIGLRGVARLEFDRSVEGMRNFLCGVNQTDTHALDVNFGRDLPVPTRYIDVHSAQGGHGCPMCEASLIEKRGIEVGHVFQLQQRYSSSLEATYSRPDGREEVAWMGCYGIGTTRLLQAIAEDTHDEHGLRWPVPVAPYDVTVVLARPSEAPDPVLAAAVEGLRAAGLRVLVDDRSGSAGVKLKDADLVGCPVRVVVGRRADDGIVEVRGRIDGREFDVDVGGVATAVAGVLDRAGAVLA